MAYQPQRAFLIELGLPNAHKSGCLRVPDAAGVHTGGVVLNDLSEDVRCIW